MLNEITLAIQTAFNDEIYDPDLGGYELGGVLAAAVVRVITNNRDGMKDAVDDAVIAWGCGGFYGDRSDYIADAVVAWIGAD